MKFLYNCILIIIYLVYFNGVSEALVVIKSHHRVPNYCYFIAPSDKTPLQDPEIENAQILKATKLADQDQTPVLAKINAVIPKVMKTLVIEFLKQQIQNHADILLAHCKQFEDIPPSLKRDYIQCGNKHSGETLIYVRSYMEKLTSMPKFTPNLRKKYQDCKLYLENLMGNDDIARDKRQTYGMNELESNHNDTSSIENISYGGANVRPLSDVNLLGSKLGKIEHFKYSTVLNNFKVYRQSKVALNTANVVQDYLTDVYENYDLVRSMKNNIGQCALIKLDLFMEENCEGYVPDAADRKQLFQ